MKNLYFIKATTILFTFFITGVLLITTSCRDNTREQDRNQEQPVIESRDIVREVEPRAYSGDIRRVGNEGNDISGEIAMRIEGDLMRFTVSAEGLAPDMMHMQYLLVSQTGDETQCPGSVEEVETMGESNGTTTVSGTTIRRIPLHTSPTNLNIDADTYPRTNVNGDLQFTQVISMDSLRAAVRDQYQMQDFDFSKLTFVIRGIPEAQSTSDRTRSSRSAPDIPVGCAKLQEVPITD
jgi:hypothetical protein